MFVRAFWVVCLTLQCFAVQAQFPGIDFHFGNPDDNNRGSASVTDEYGGVWFAGTASNGVEGSDDLWVYRINSNNEIIWSQSYGDNRNEFVNKLIAAASDELLICGEVLNTTTGDLNALLIAIDTSGNILWQREYGEDITNEEFYDVAIAASGDIFTTGFHSPLTGTGNDILIVKYASDGSFLQDRVFGIDRNDIGMALVTLPGGNVMVSGDRLTIDGYYNPFVAKLNADLEIISDVDIVSSLNSGCKAMQLIAPNKMILIGETESALLHEFDVMFVETDTNANIITKKGVPFAGPDAGYDFVMQADSTVVVTGFGHNPATGENEMLVLHLDAEGNQLERRFYGETGADLGFDIQIDNAGDLYISGFHTNADTVFFSLVRDAFELIQGVNGFEIGNDALIYPNPVQSEFCVESDVTINQIRLFDLSGRELTSPKIIGNNCFLLASPLASGIYYIQMYTSVYNFTYKIKAG